MTRRIVWLAAGVALCSAFAILALSLAFVPPSAYSAFLPVAVVVLCTSVIVGALLGEWTGLSLARPLRQMVRSIEAEDVGVDTLRQFAAEAPDEIVPLLSALHHTHQTLRRALDQLELDRAQMATVFQHMADGVLVVGADERIELTNPAALRMIRRRTIHGRRLAEVVRDAELVEITRAATTDGPVVQVVELHGETAGAKRWIQVVATRLPSERRTLVLLQDVSELRRAEASRRDFVANISHELRTPISALKAIAETLEGGALDEPHEARTFLARMHYEVDRLTHLVSDLLELARVEAGRLDLLTRPEPAEDLVESAIGRMRTYAERLGIRIEQANAPPVHTRVLADERRIGQVLTNLLANAVKFTPPGGVIEVGAREDGVLVEFWVKDSGIGIASGNLVRVFERFYKADPSRSGAGTGLGLAICKHLVRAHGGEIWAESDGEERGATFRFSLPRAESAHAPDALPISPGFDVPVAAR